MESVPVIVVGPVAGAAPVPAQQVGLGGPVAVEVARRHVVEHEEHAAGREHTRQVGQRAVEIGGMDERLDSDDRVETGPERPIVALYPEPAGVGDPAPACLALRHGQLDPAQRDALIAATDPGLPVEDRPAEAAARVEHPGSGPEASNSEQSVIDVLDARRAAVGGFDPQLLVHGERREAVPVGQPVRQLDVAGQPVVVRGELLVGDHSEVSLAPRTLLGGY